MAHVLVVDDERSILESLRRIFEREGYNVTCTDSGEEALDIIRKQAVDVVLADIMMPKMSGIDLLRAVRTMAPGVEVLMMTAFGTVENAVECMREGAYDFISKPLRRALVVSATHRALERRTLVRENRSLREILVASGGDDIVGQSECMQRVLQTLRQAAPSTATVLLSGESGTGKELLARLVHKLSDRASGPFVAVNCGALPEQLLESELFGHERGAFTGAAQKREGRFERAHLGTLFLDEVAETTAALQVRLLRALQEGEIERVGGEQAISVDVRVIAATNQDLEEEIAEGRFRADLYYRLNVIRVHVPTLHERIGDIPLLAQHFLRRYTEKNKKDVRGYSDAALRALCHYSWPGNVRELQNAVERAVVLCPGDVIEASDLPEAIMGAAAQSPPSQDGILVPIGTTLDEIERQVIRETLRRTDGDKKTAARLLGIASRTIYRKL